MWFCSSDLPKIMTIRWLIVNWIIRVGFHDWRQWLKIQDWYLFYHKISDL